MFATLWQENFVFLFASKSVQIKVQRTIVLPIVLHGRELGLLNWGKNSG